MHKSILVLEESRMVHELFESALPEDYLNWEINHESLPDRYLQKAKDTKPDIIFLSNQDQKRNYTTVKQLKASAISAQTPILLLTSAKDKLDENLLQSIGVRGFVRKPFETATLQKQINVVLKEQELSKKKKPFDRFKDLNVVDDDLMDLLGGRTKPEVSIDDLEGELDPTLQLIPSDESDEESEETELLAMDDTEEQLQTEFIDDDDSNEITDDLEYEDDEFDADKVDSDFDEIELEELDDETDSTDLDDVNAAVNAAAPNGQTVRLIKVEQVESSKLRNPLLNEPDDKYDLGFMDLHVVPFRTDKIKSHVVETITDDFDEEKFVKAHSPAELEHDFISTDRELKSYKIGDNDEIEIHHEEIIEDFYEGDDDSDEQDLAENDLLELSIEGMEGELSDDTGSTDDAEAEVVTFEELEDSDDTLEEINIQDVDLPTELEDDEEESSLVIQEELDDSEQEIATLEQEDGIDIEIDFQNDPTAELSAAESSQQLFESFDDEEFDEDSLTESELEKRRADQLDIDLEEIAAAGSEEASATIQEMIGFRQVMKAKYELPDDDLGIAPDTEEGEDDFDDEISDDEDLLAEVESDLGEDDALLAEVPEDLDLPEDQNDSFEVLSGENEDDSRELELLTDEDNIDLPDGDVALLSDDENDKLEDIDLTSDFEDEHKSETTDIEGDVFDDAELFSDQIDKEDGDGDMFEDPDEISVEEEELLGPLDDDEADLFSEVSEPEDDQDESFEEIELLTDEDPGNEEESESGLLVDEEDADDDIDTLIFDEEDMEDDLSLDVPDDPFAMKNGLSDAADDIDAMTPESMEDIDFLPIDEDSDESDVELAVEIDSEDEDSFVSETTEDEAIDDSIDDIDFLPVDEEEALSEKSDIDEVPFIGADEEFKVDGEEPDDEIDFLPTDLEMEDDDEELPEPEAELLDQELLTGRAVSLDDADENMIEVPQETFEMNDFNVRDITNDEEESPLTEQQDEEEEEEEQEYNLMDGIETVKANEMATPEEPESEMKSYENIELPTMDEDLPDLPPILGVDQSEAEPVFDPNELSESRKSDIRLMQNEYDFDEFDSQNGIIGVVEKPGASVGAISVSHRDEIKRQVKKAAVSLTPEFRKKLSAMIEGVVSETVHNTLQERLPELVEKLLHEELGDEC